MRRLWAESVPVRFRDVSTAEAQIMSTPESGRGSLQVRLRVIRLSLSDDHTLEQIASMANVSVASAKNYRSLFKRGGLNALLRLRTRGRPRKPRPRALRATMRQALERLKALHYPTLRSWVRHWGIACPSWMIREVVAELISDDPSLAHRLSGSDPREFWAAPRTRRKPDPAQRVFDLNVAPSQGLLPWHGCSLPQNSHSSYSPKGRPSSNCRSASAPSVQPSCGTPGCVFSGIRNIQAAAAVQPNRNASHALDGARNHRGRESAECRLSRVTQPMLPFARQPGALSATASVRLESNKQRAPSDHPPI
jgi:transposase